MKASKIVKGFAVLLTMACVLSVDILPVQAGLREVTTDASSFAEEIDATTWHNANKDVVAEQGVIVFPNESTADTRLTAKTVIAVDKDIPETASVAGNFKFTSLPRDQKFVIVFGLKSIESDLGEAGNVEVAFENKGGLTVSITAYSKEGEAVELMAAKKCGSLSGTTVKAVLMADQTFALSIGGGRIYNGKLPVSGEGRFGFLQTGSCGVRISDINVTIHEYNRPENCDIDEDFEQGIFNRNLLTSQMIETTGTDDECYVGIDEIEGNKVFRFKNAGGAYLGTKYMYSNFEMSFDVPYLQRSNEMDDERNVTNKKSSNIILSFGSETATFTEKAHSIAAERLVFTTASAITTKSNGTTTKLDSVFPFFDPEHDKGFSIKVRMVDGECTVFMKWMKESKWTEVLSYDVQTPTGTIQLWGQGGNCNWAIDNLKVVNLDSNPNLIKVEYASSKIEVPEDYKYEPMEKVYMQEEATEDVKEEISLYWLIPAVFGVCVVAFGGTIAAVNIKRHKRKGGVSNEE